MIQAEIEVFRFRVRMERLRLAVTRGDEEFPMREVRNLAGVLNGIVAKLKADTERAVGGLQNEVSRTASNISKVHSVTKELGAANQEVEEALSGVGSNFPTGEEESETQSTASTLPNGVKPHSP